MKISLNIKRGAMLAGPAMPRNMELVGTVQRDNGDIGALVKIADRYCQLNAPNVLRSLPQEEVILRLRQARVGRQMSPARLEANKANAKTAGRPGWRVVSGSAMGGISCPTHGNTADYWQEQMVVGGETRRRCAVICRLCRKRPVYAEMNRDENGAWHDSEA